MKLPTHKGKLALLVIYVIVVFLSPFYTIVSYDPAKVSDMIAKFVPEKDNQFFLSYISLLKDQKVSEAYTLLSTEAQQASKQEDLNAVAKQFANITDNITVVGANINYIKDESPRTVYAMSYEIVNNDPEKKYMGVSISARDLGQGVRVDGVQTYFGAQSLMTGGKFRFPKPDWTLIVAILAPLFVIYTAYRYLTKATKPNWWMLLVILLGSVYVVVRVDGGFSAHFGFNGFIGLAGLFGPWVYNPVLPLGAIVYYFFLKKFEGGNTVSNP